MFHYRGQKNTWELIKLQSENLFQLLALKTLGSLINVFDS